MIDRKEITENCGKLGGEIRCHNKSAVLLFEAGLLGPDLTLFLKQRGFGLEHSVKQQPD